MFFKKKKEDISQKEFEVKREETLLTLKDIIAPPSIDIQQDYLRLGEKYAKTFFVFSYPNQLVTNWLSPIINFDRIFDLSMFIYPMSSEEVLRTLQRKITEVEADIMDRQQKGLVRDPKLDEAYKNIEDLRDKLITASEKIFKFGLYFTIYGDSLDELSKIEKEIRQMLESQLIFMKPALFRQKQGLISSAPLLIDEIQVSFQLNTSPLSTTFPFVSFELSSDRGILYGINQHNSSLILFDRFSLENANMVIFAKSGSGKSYFQKLEILRSLISGVNVIVIDPENEYQYLAETVGGSYFNISLASPHHINPLDVPLPIEGESPESAFRSNLINLVGLIRLMLGGLSPEEDTLIDKALTQAYALKDISPETIFERKSPPLLSDLQSILEGIEGAESLSLRLQRYTSGTLGGFLNKPTNVSMQSQLVVFSIRDLEEELRPVAMYIILRYIWNIVRSELKKRILVVDEAWWLMQHDDSASFLYGMAKRARKYYLGVSTITQDVNDFMMSSFGQPIISNSSLQLLLKQSLATIDVVQSTFNLTKEEKNLLLAAEVGEGLFFAGTKHAAIKVVASYTEDQIITTDPEQILEIRKAKRELND